jgi:hypothetical protein
MTRTGSPSGSGVGLISITRSIRLPPGGMASPGLQFGTALGSVGGSAGEPSSCCSVKVKGIRRYPSGQVLAEIDRLYGISPRDLDLDPDDFAQRLADRDRLEHVRWQRRGPTSIRSSGVRASESFRSRAGGSRECPRQESNLRTRFRKPLLFH